MMVWVLLGTRSWSRDSYPRELFPFVFKGKFPGTIGHSLFCFRRTGQALGSHAGVNGLGKDGKFDHSNGAAGKEWHPLSFPCCLHPAGLCGYHEGLFVRAKDLCVVDMGKEAVGKSDCECIKAHPVREGSGAL